MESEVTKLDELRKYLRISNNTFAKQIGVDPSYWSLIRSGKRRVTAKFVDKVLRVYPSASAIFQTFQKSYELPVSQKTTNNVKTKKSLTLLETTKKKEFIQRLGNTVRELRNGRRLKQTELAKLSGLSPSCISQIEKGEYGIPSLKAIKQLDKALRAKRELFKACFQYDRPSHSEDPKRIIIEKPLETDVLIEVEGRETQILNNIFGQHVRKLREEKQWRQWQLAKLCDLSKNTIWNIEKDRVSSLSVRTLNKLDRVLGQKGHLISLYFRSMRLGPPPKTRIARKATETRAKTKVDLPESSREDDALVRLQRTMSKATVTYATIQSESIIFNLAKIQKLHELRDDQFAESIGISERVWSLAKQGRTALRREKVERIIELFPEVVPISFDENAKRRFGNIVKKMRKHTRLTQKEVEDDLGLSPGLVSRVERGKNIDLSLRTIKNLDKELNAHGELEHHAFGLLSKGKGPLRETTY